MKTVTAGQYLSHEPGMPRSLWLLDGIFFALAAVFVCLAPCGMWKNVAGGQVIWDNNDPGGPYVISSLFFYQRFGHPPFVGHPGVTLQAMIGGVAHAIYGVRSWFGDSEGFLGFWAKNIRWLFIVSGLITAMMHLVSFHVVYAFARRLLGDAKPAFLAVVGYATLFPTLFYATRISVEPILVSLVLLVFLNLWQMQDAWEAGQHRRAYWLGCLAGAVSAGAILTKVHLSFPLVPLCALQIFLQGGGRGVRFVERIATRYKLELCYLAVGVGVLYVGSLSMDLGEFFGTWKNYTPIGKQLRVGETGVVDRASQESLNAGMGVSTTLWDTYKTRAKAYVTPGSYQSIFTITEAGFVVLSGLGLMVFWMTRRDKRGLVIWPLLYGMLLLPVAGYRGAWHYLFFHLAVGSVFFGFVLHAGGHRLLSQRIRPGVVNGLLILLILVVHSVSIVLAFGSKCDDVKVYRSTYRAFHDALARLHPGQRIAVLAGKEMRIWRIHGSYYVWSRTAEAFHDEFDRRFIVVRKGQVTREMIAANQVGAVVDVRQVPWRLERISRYMKGRGKSTTRPGPSIPSTRNAQGPG